MADGPDGLKIIDISDPTAPILVASCDTMFAYTWSIYVIGNYAYVVDEMNSSGLKIYNISNPSAPIWVSEYRTRYPGRAVYVVDDYAYLASSASGLQIIDVSNPSTPTVVGNYNVLSYACDVYIQGHYAYIADCDSGLVIVDISIPGAPTLAGSYHTPGFALALNIANDYVLVADYFSLQILRFNPTGINDDNNPVPNAFSLSQNYPNPFNASTTISYSLAKSGAVNLSIYNLLGQKVGTLSDCAHSIIWDAKDFTSGIYIAKLEAGNRTNNIKMVLMK